MSLVFKDFPEAQEAIRLELLAATSEVQPEMADNVYVADRPEFRARELYNFMYTVLEPEYTEVDGIHEAWLEQEWLDRLAGDLNPGNAWKQYPELWESFLEKPSRVNGKLRGMFSYSYSQRMGGGRIQDIIDELKLRPHSRQLYLPVWDRIIDGARRGKRRVPCTLGYWFVYREQALHLTYIMRACDFVTHYGNDVALATALLRYVANKADMEVGTFTHFTGSLHVYAKDLKGIQ